MARMHTICLQKMREYGKNEKWKPYPTKENILINQKTLLLYRKTKAGSFRRIPQKMTVLQELEDFRKADGVVRMTSRS